MKKQFLSLAAAVAATLAGGTAFALPPAGPFTVQLTIAGSSAFEGALENELVRSTSSICQGSTFSKFQAENAFDFRAYTCNLAPGAVSAGGGETAVIYYRGEGGSVNALRPLLAGSQAILRLQLSGCNFNQAQGTLGVNTCPNTGFTALNDTANTGLETANPQLGFTDEEPTVFAGENYPTATTFSYLQPALSATERATLNTAATAVVGQAFGVYVNTQNAELATVGNLSKNTLANIFKGTYSDWNFVPNGSGGTVTTTTLPIRVCRREAGSGTQVAASLFFNATSGFVSEAQPGNLAIGLGGGGVKENASSGAMRTCLDGTAGAIGYISSEADQGVHRQIQIDGQGTLSTEIANNLGPLIATGQYDFWYEMTAIKRAGLTGTANTLANKLISVTQSQATGPTSPNIAFLSPFNPANYPLATAAGKQPVSCVRRNKVSPGIAIWQC